MMRIFCTNMNISDFVSFARFKKITKYTIGRLYLGIIYMDMVFVPYAYDIFVKKTMHIRIRIYIKSDFLASVALHTQILKFIIHCVIH